MRAGQCILGVVAGVVLGSSAMASLPRPETIAVPFVERAGAPGASPRYTTRVPHAAVAVESDGTLRYGLHDAHAGAWAAVLAERAVGACRLAPRGSDPTPTRVTRFGGPAGDEIDCATFGRVELGEAWPGIELALRTDGRNVEKILTLAPGSDASAIELAVEGARRLVVSDRGDLLVLADGGSLGLSRPVAFQERDGRAVPVDVAYRVAGTSYGFDLGPHDPALPVVIDPFLQSTYVGGTVGETIADMAVHPVSGEVYACGQTTSSDLPATAGGVIPSYSRDGDGFVVRLSADLTTILQATYFAGGRSGGSVTRVAVHPGNGDVYILGSGRDNPPSIGGAAQVNGFPYFVSRLNPALTDVVRSSGIGPGVEFTPFRVAFLPGATGDVLIAGRTDRPEQYDPLSGGPQPALAAGFDGFVLRMSDDLTAFTGGTYLGGNGLDEIHGLGVHPVNGDVYVAGYTTSTDLPGVAGGYQSALAGTSDTFVVRLNPELTAFVNGTLFGGPGIENMTNNGGVPTGDLAFLAGGDVILMGEVMADGLPESATGAIPSYQGLNGDDVFLARLSADLATVTRSTYWSPEGGAERGTDIAIEPGDTAIWLAGWTQALTALPASGNAPQPSNGGSFDAFVSRIKPDLTSIEASTYIGGADYEDLAAMRRHPISGEIYVAGTTRSDAFPAIAGGADTTFAGAGASDGWIMRLTLEAPPCPGDCDDDGTVVLLEVATVSDLALGRPGSCPAADSDGVPGVTAVDVVMALLSAFLGC